MLDPDPIDRPAWLARLEGAMGPWRGAGVVVAVSGGGDSVGLLRGLVAVGPGLDLRLTVACFDHATRAGESARDAAFVANLAARLGLPCDLGTWRDRPRGGNFEALARRARYAWLVEVAARRGAGVVAVGHTLDDQAETILHRVVRGTGLRGLAGIRASRPLAPGVALARPLLGVGRDEIRADLRSIGQDWREDATNQDRSRTRARLRHDLLPRLAADYNPAVADALIRLGHLAGAASRRLDRRAARRLDRATVARDEGGITLDRPQLGRLDPAARAEVLRLAWRREGWPERRMDHARWLRLADRAAEGEAGRWPVAAGIEALADADHLILRRTGPAQAPAVPALPPRPLAVPGAVAWPGGRVVASPAPFDPPAPGAEWVDRDQLIDPLIVRSPQPGDRFEPLGLDGRSQPLADFLRARRVPRAARPLVPLVCDAAGIVWVAGHRIAHRVRRTAATTRTLGLRFEPAVGPELGRPG